MRLIAYILGLTFVELRFNSSNVTSIYLITSRNVFITCNFKTKTMCIGTNRYLLFGIVRIEAENFRYYY